MGDYHLATLPLLPRSWDVFGIQGGGRSSSGHAAPAAFSWDAAPAAPVQQKDPRYPAPEQQHRPSGPDLQRQAATAAKNQQAVGTCEDIEKATTEHRLAECLAFKGEGDHYLATVPLLPLAGTLPLLPPAGTPLLPIPSSRMIPATLLTSSGTGL